MIGFYRFSAREDADLRHPAERPDAAFVSHLVTRIEICTAILAHADEMWKVDLGPRIAARTDHTRMLTCLAHCFQPSPRQLPLFPKSTKKIEHSYFGIMFVLTFLASEIGAGHR